uniref:DUF222 domain-containing protein n=1 Tax=Ascaris lumbricoides TaxID=6252 RepID=A0A0M3I6C2_ASCLU
MATIYDSLPDLLLAIMGVLGLVIARRCRDAFAAAAALFGLEEVELYREVEQFLRDRWNEELAALDIHSRGLQYFGSARTEKSQLRPSQRMMAARRSGGVKLSPPDIGQCWVWLKIALKFSHHSSIEHGEYRDYFLVCRLADCGVSDREFETVGAWKKHVALARCHVQDAFCASCGHHVIVPQGTAPENIKAFITAHKKERCIGAAKAIFRQRRADVVWLESLARNTSHILVPGQLFFHCQPLSDS